MNASVSIINNVGQAVVTSLVSSETDQANINMAKLPQGIYRVVVCDANEGLLYTQPVIKQ
jgi:hypothetical protein